ncbi:hypothetical protein CYMTET_15412 [Cymbomonas tetramitiformis]|uniref:EF-hand domain-containing protein n=1 Tax=Cymbomonas tetramitiformis TaxID=36881 RepID=A0AAE0L965_9CHLO|nr:hypothetical protein CYMTET_15412 [Cymbomonas tetramitiformis]
MSHAELFSQAIPAFADIDSNQDGNLSVYEYRGVLEAFKLFLSQTNESARGGIYPASSRTNDDLERRSLFHGGRRRLSSDSDSSGSELEANGTASIPPPSAVANTAGFLSVASEVGWQRSVAST